MVTTESPDLCTYELPLTASDAPAPGPRLRLRGLLPETLLVKNELWFCRLRWIAIGILLAFGAAGYVPGLFARLGLRDGLQWPFISAGVLTIANAGFLIHARLLDRSPSPSRGVAVNLWGQIVIDLLVLTVVVHFIGSVETCVPFVYLFHIVLACIFFSLRQSAIVAILACVLYAGCVAGEVTGPIPPAGMYDDAVLRLQIVNAPTALVVNVATALAIWTGGWYLVSKLSGMVRERDHRLAEANQRMELAQTEKARHMLRTTHELKAPFAAIHANTQILLGNYCGELPAEAQHVLERIARRCARLSMEIQEMLQLSNLKSDTEKAQLRFATLDISQVLQQCIGHLRPVAQERKITIEEALEHAEAWVVPDHAMMLFGNLLSNAVHYSHVGGQVRVRCYARPTGEAVAEVADHGIGIPADKLPHIFDEYYRTDEAARHNRESTGLGLAIVRHVAQTHGLRVRVDSRPGDGSTFTITFPHCSEAIMTEAHHGSSNDR